MPARLAFRSCDRMPHKPDGPPWQPANNSNPAVSHFRCQLCCLPQPRLQAPPGYTRKHAPQTRYRDKRFVCQGLSGNIPERRYAPRGGVTPGAAAIWPNGTQAHCIGLCQQHIRLLRRVDGHGNGNTSDDMPGRAVTRCACGHQGGRPRWAAASCHSRFLVM